jgi:Ulp1 family protease
LINTRKQGNKSLYLKYKSQNYYIFNSFFYEYLDATFDKEEYYTKLIRGFSKTKTNLKVYKRILIPIFSRKRKEWSLISVDLKNRHLLVYNSHKPDDQLTYLIEEANIINNILSFFNYYLDNKIFDVTKEEKFSSKINLEHKKTNNTRFTSDLSTQYISTKTITSSNNTVEDFNLDSDNSFDSEMNEIWEKLNINDDEKSQDNINNAWHYSKASNPLQKNENDGGVYMCKFIDYLSRDEPITFTHEDIEYFRILMSIELLESDLNSY